MRKKKGYAIFALEMDCAMAVTTTAPVTSVTLAANQMTIALQERKSRADSIQALF